MLDFNRVSLSGRPVNKVINELIGQIGVPVENVRQYLGASSIGSECSRKIQFDWLCDARFQTRTLDIFDRGHWGEDISRRHMIAAGFKFAPKEQLEFSAVDGLLQGHADGILTAGPRIPALRYPCIWEHKCLNAKGWRAIERDGLTGLYASYASQAVLYQAYLDCTNDALFCVLNADTCERLNFTVPFNAALAQEMTDKAVAIIEATKAGELLPRVTDNPEDWRCKMCGHRARCWTNTSSGAASTVGQARQKAWVWREILGGGKP
jgi:hypothetical protein